MAAILSERLQAAMESAREAAAQLPPDRQDALAERIEQLLEEVADAAWGARFADPRSRALFAELAGEADAAEAAGTTRPFPKAAGWTEVDEVVERELDRRASIPTPEEEEAQGRQDAR
jgi:hypothetical protein